MGRFRAIPVQGIDFVMFMVSGIVPFHLMRSLAYRLTDAVPANQGLFAYRQLMPFDTFIARLIVELCTYTCAYLIICFVIGFWLGRDVRINDPLAWLLALGDGVLLSFALGVAFAMISHRFPSMSRVCRLSFIPIYLTAGVFFPIWRVPQDKLIFIAWNPYVEVIDNIRAATFENYPVTEGLNSSYPVYFSLILLFIVMAVYRGQRQILRAPRP
jgi:capsular polysaccharide transport system permease protein